MERQRTATRQEEDQLLKQHITQLRSRSSIGGSLIVIVAQGNLGCSARFFEHALRDSPNVKFIRDQRRVGVHQFRPLLSHTKEMGKRWIQEERIMIEKDLVCVHKPKETRAMWQKQYDAFLDKESRYHSLDMMDCWLMNVWVEQAVRQRTLTVVPPETH